MMKYLLLLTFSVLCHFATAQGLHFSTTASPFGNPANIGSGSENYEGRIQLNHRNQWGALLGGNSFNTSVATYDQRFGLAKDDFWGVGAILSSDKAGSVGFSHTVAGLGASLLKHLGGNRLRKTFLSAGVLGSFNQRSVDADKILFADQLQFGSTDESLQLISRSYLDLGVGMQFWSFPQRNQSFKYAYRFGGSAFHVNGPIVGFLSSESEFRLPTRILLEVSGLLKVSSPAHNPVYIIGSISWEKHGSVQKLLPHTQVRFDLPTRRWKNAWIQFGTGARLNNTDEAPFSDAIVFDFSFQIQQVQLGFFYDWNISPLAASQGLGSFEISLQYLIPTKVKRGVSCPNF